MGKPTGSDLTHKQAAVSSPLPNTIKLSESYGIYTNVG